MQSSQFVNPVQPLLQSYCSLSLYNKWAQPSVESAGVASLMLNGIHVGYSTHASASTAHSPCTPTPEQQLPFSWLQVIQACGPRVRSALATYSLSSGIKRMSYVCSVTSNHSNSDGLVAVCKEARPILKFVQASVPTGKYKPTILSQPVTGHQGEHQRQQDQTGLCGKQRREDHVQLDEDQKQQHQAQLQRRDDKHENGLSGPPAVFLSQGVPFSKTNVTFLAKCLETANISTRSIPQSFRCCLESLGFSDIHDCQKLERLRSSEITLAISRVMSVVNRSQRSNGATSKFDAVRVPTISAQDYFVRLVEYFNCSASCHLVSVIYIDRLVKRCPIFPVDALNIHRLLVTATVIAAKFYDDRFLSNGYYAQIGGITTREINRLETHLLSLLNYQLVVSPEEFEHHANLVLQQARLLPLNTD